MDVLEALTEFWEDEMETLPKYREKFAREAREREAAGAAATGPEEETISLAARRRKREENPTRGPDRCKSGHALVFMEKVALLQPDPEQSDAYNMVNET